MKRPTACHPALVLLLACLLAVATPLQAQTTPPRDQESQSEREPTMRELGAMMGQMMGQMGEMMGDMAQNMGSTMQRMMERMQKEGSLRDPKNEHIEGKLAFLKAELQITSAQENAWSAFADAMRKAAAMKPPGRDSGATLPERMDDQTRILQHRLAVMQAKKTAIDKLYAQLDARQKGLADDLIEQIGLV